jgi:beta-glucanase (GH16 family)
MRLFRYAITAWLALLALAAPASADFSHLAFSDGFNGTTASIAQKWNVADYCNFGPGPPNGASQACFTNDGQHATESDGLLSLRATYQPKCGADESFTCWLSAQLSSKTTVTPPLKLVARVWVAPGVGMWSGGAWMGNGCMEVDSLEQLGRTAIGNTQSVHRWGCTGSHASVSKFADLDVPLADAFHTYAAKVYADRVNYSIDGKRTNQIRDSELGGVGSWRMLRPMTFKTSLNVGTCWGWAGCPDYTDTQIEYVDWYRVYTP